MDLSVIAPIYNEESNIHLLYERITSVMKELNVSYELIMINDGSRDNSMKIIKELANSDQNVKYVDLSRNFGHQIAVTAGLQHATGNAIAIIDADLQDPPELIKDLYKKYKEGFEVVYAQRKRRKGESWLRLFLIRIFYRLLARITSVKIPVDTGDFRIVDRKVVDVVNQMEEQEKFIRGQIAWVGFNQTYVEYDRDERQGGETGYPYSKLIKLALDGITSFSDFPLKMVSVLGFVVSGIAFIMILYIFYAKYIKETAIQGWTSTMITILFLGGIQLLAIGVIGEYLSRMSANIRKRPLYVIKESNTEIEKKTDKE